MFPFISVILNVIIEIQHTTLCLYNEYPHALKHPQNLFQYLANLAAIFYFLFFCLL